MTILWVNPSFLDYRVSLYRELNLLSNNNFFIVYSKNRVPLRVQKKIEFHLGKNALGLEGEKSILLGEKNDTANTHLRLPYQPKLWNTIKKIKADIVITEGFFQWTPFSLLKKYFSNIPILLAYERTKHTERNCPKWREAYRKIITKFIDGYIVNGTLTKEYLLSFGIPENKIFTGGMSADSEGLYNKVKQLSFDEISFFRNKFKITETPIFLYIGQFIERKGVIELINNWKIYKNNNGKGTLICVGDGKLFEKCKNLIVSEKISEIFLTGAIDYDEIYKFYAIADVFIIATLEDNWSLVVPEAMACGLPIACSKYNGCSPDLIFEGHNGKVFDPLNTVEFLDTLFYFSNNFDILKKLGYNSIEIEKKFNTINVANNIYNACKAIISKNEHTPTP